MRSRAWLPNPKDLAKSLGALLEAAGMRLIAYYLTMGENDILVISEGDGDQGQLMSVLIAAAAGGGVTNLNTSMAITSAEAKAQFAAAGKLAAGFKSAGKS
jgi:uncharacterized protein with GYD domain